MLTKWNRATSRDLFVRRITSPVHHQKMPMKIRGITSYIYVIFRADFWRLWNVLIGVYILHLLKSNNGFAFDNAKHEIVSVVRKKVYGMT